MRLHILSGLLAALVLAACAEPTTFTPAAPTVPAPRLPMNNAYVGSVHDGRPLRPEFVWEASTATSSEQIRYELQLSTSIGFSDVDVVADIKTFDTSYQPDADLPVSRNAPVGARYFWRLRACVVDSCTPYTRPWYVNLGRAIKDYNGDGFSDVVVGAPANSAFFTFGGRSYVYFGGPGPSMDATADVTLGRINEVGPGAQMGVNISSIGDVNGDGFADLAWSRKSSTTDRIGIAFLYLGAPSGGFDSIPDSEISTGGENDGFGSSVGGLGDVNNDGFDDLFTITAREGAGAASGDVYFGNSGPKIDAKSDLTLQLRGYLLATVGDVNGDGASDLAAGEPSNDTGGTAAGVVHLYLGAAGVALDTKEDALLVGRGYYDQFGSSVATAGDVNGDGFSDVIVGNSRNADNGDGKSGSVELFFGGPGTFDVTPDAIMSGLAANDSFGERATSAGDVNGDGFDDILIGAHGTDLLLDHDLGRAYLYLGGSGEFDTFIDAMFTGRTAFAYLGYSVSFAGDVNGDGIGDIAIGADGDDRDRGRVDIYLGTAGAAPDTGTDGMLLGEAMSDAFGKQIAEAPLPTCKIASASSSAASLTAAPSSRAPARAAAPTCRAAAAAVTRVSGLRS